MSLQIHDVVVVPEGDGVDVKRLFPIHGRMNFDPFVLWDHFDIGPGRGFPDHPHRGFEAITYMFDGGMNHKDNLGNASFVSVGGAQRFTAGSGMVHSEMPAESGKSNGIQLWINLPRRLKQIAPSYQQVDDAEFPVQQIEGGTIKWLVGEDSPLKLNTEVLYQHVELDENARYEPSLNAEWQGIIYLMKGELEVNSQCIQADQALFVEQEPRLEIIAKQASEFMLCFGKPHGEPIHQYGPFVD